jgi:hypothetical protein
LTATIDPKAYPLPTHRSAPVPLSVQLTVEFECVDRVVTGNDSNCTRIDSWAARFGVRTVVWGKRFFSSLERIGVSSQRQSGLNLN